MIHDKLERLCKYLPEQYVKKVDEYLKNINAGSEETITEISGKDVYGRVMSYPTKLEENAKIEAHDVYVDIQFSIVGSEGISLFARKDMEKVDSKPEKDFYEYKGDAVCQGQVANLPGYFTMIFPHEAHRPQESLDRSCSVVKKGVIKIKADCFN